MIFLRVLPKIFLWPHYTRGPQELGGPGSLNSLNPRFLRHWSSSSVIIIMWPRRIWSFCIKGFGHKQRGTPKI